MPPVVAADSRPNIFSPQQEVWLGEAYRDRMEANYAAVTNPELNRHLQEIVDRLAKNVPEPHVPFRAVMVESSDVNAFSIAGGSIYVTRKLVSVTKSEDELAAVVGHEMGHIASHQFAFEMTAEMQRLLHVNSVTDRADIFAKFQALIDASMKDKRPPKDTEDIKQEEADRIGVYLAAAAGYSAASFPGFYDRTQFVNGKTGSKWTDFVGTTTADQKRLRNMRDLVQQLPKDCGAGHSEEAEAKVFTAWQKLVIENQKSHDVDSQLAGAKPLTLHLPLQVEVTRLRFSPDGKYLLAQNESSVYVLTRDPFAVLFRFDAVNAQYAWFSPDSKTVTFTTPGMHTEQWSIADQKLIAAHELLAKHHCVQARLSPDGRTSICLTFDVENWWMGLSLFDTTSEEAVWEKPKFFQPSWRDAIDFESYYLNQVPSESMLMSYSADENSLLIGPGYSKIAFDLRTRTPVKLSSELADWINGTYAFVGNDKVAGIRLDDSRGSGIFSFPSGKRIRSSDFSISDLESVANPGDNQWVLSASLHDMLMDPNAKPDKKEGYKNAAKMQDKLAVLDLSGPKYLWGVHSTGLDIWNSWAAIENVDGTISLHSLTDGFPKELKRLTLPPSPLGLVHACALSPDGRFLAYSTRDRGAVWDLQSGARLTLLQSFSDVAWLSDTKMVGNFQKSSKEDRQIAEFDFAKLQAKTLNLKVDSSEKEVSGMEYSFYEDWKAGKGKAKELSVLKFDDGSVVFTKQFPDGYPRWTTSYGGRDFIFSYPMKSGTGKTLISADLKLRAEADAVGTKDNGRVIEVVNGSNGNVLARTVVEVPMDYAGTSGLNSAGDNLFVTGQDNRTVVYSLSTGKRIWQTFGWVKDVDPGTGRVMITNRSDEEIVLDASGHELLHTHLGYPVRFAKFQQNGTRLMMLTSDQSVRTVDLPTQTAAVQ